MRNFLKAFAFNSIVIGGSTFPHKRKHKITWVSLDHSTENQIDHICISMRLRRSQRDVRVYRGADVASDHYLVVAKLRLKLSITIPVTPKQHQGTTSNSFKIYPPSKPFRSHSAKAYQAVADLEDAYQQQSIENVWKERKQSRIGISKKIPGPKKTSQRMDHHRNHEKDRNQEEART